MQYWTEEDGPQPFDCWLKQHTCPIPDIQQLRQRYHDMISAALVTGSDGQSEMDGIDRTIAKMWADAAQKTNQSDIGIDLTSAGTSMTPDTTTPPNPTKEQRTNIEDKLRGRATEPANPATKQLSLHARRRRASQSSTGTKCTLSTRRHQGRRHQSSVQANSSINQSQRRPNIKSSSTGNTRQQHNVTHKQQHTGLVKKGTMLGFLRPNSSNKTKDNALTEANAAYTRAQNTKRKSYETEPHLTQCSKNEQTSSPQRLTVKRKKADGIFSDRYEELLLLTLNLMGTTTVLDELQTLAQEHKPCIMVLTETKLTELEQDRKLLSTCLPDYKLYHSRVKGHKTGRQRTGSAGVTIAVHASLTTQNSVQLINLDHPAAKGHCKCMKLQPSGSEALTIWGVYIPCTDMQTRKEVYN